jgi:hypothetical protein
LPAIVLLWNYHPAASGRLQRLISLPPPWHGRRWGTGCYIAPGKYLPQRCPAVHSNNYRTANTIFVDVAMIAAIFGFMPPTLPDLLPAMARGILSFERFDLIRTRPAEAPAGP